MRAEATIDVEATPEQVLRFVLDLERYALADQKIGTIHEQPILDLATRSGRAKFRARLRGLPTAAQWARLDLDPWNSLTVRSEPGQWTNHVATFDAGFECERTSATVTRVTHWEEIQVASVGRLVARPLLESWLRDDIDAEVLRLKALVEQSVNGG